MRADEERFEQMQRSLGGPAWRWQLAERVAAVPGTGRIRCGRCPRRGASGGCDPREGEDQQGAADRHEEPGKTRGSIPRTG